MNARASQSPSNNERAEGSCSTTGVRVEVPRDLIEAIAERAASIVLQHLSNELAVDSPYLTIPEAASYARCKRQRIDDLLSARRLTRHKDGRRTLILRTELEAHLARQSAPSTGARNGAKSEWMSAHDRATVDRTGNKTG